MNVAATQADPKRARPGARIVVCAESTARATGAVPQVMDAVMSLGASVVGTRRLGDGTLLIEPGATAPVAIEFHAAADIGDGAEPLPLGSIRATVDAEFASTVRATLGPAPTGTVVAVVPDELTEPGPLLFITDVDSTAITSEVIDLLAEYAGTADMVADITERAMRGELDFASSLRSRVATLAGLDVGVLSKVRARINLTDGVRTTIRTIKSIGGTTAWVSGGFAEVIAPLARKVGIDHIVANTLASTSGTLTGEVRDEIVDRAAKAAAMRRIAAEHGIPAYRCVAVGDGANDLDMLAAAGLGIAFNAKPAVNELADVALPRWATMATVLYLLGLDDAAIRAACDDLPVE